MFRVLTCLGVEHDWRLVALAGMVCFIASLAAITLLHRAQATQGGLRTAWLLTAGTVTGWGIWSTHFIAMLAYDPGVGVGYELSMTVVSFVAAVGLTSIGLWVAILSRARWAAAAGGMIVGGGVAVMHYLGMSALEMPGHIIWAKDLVVTSIIIGILFGMAALVTAVHRGGLWSSLGSTVLLTIAIVSHHFTAMGAVGIITDPSRVVHESSLSPAALALGIAGIAVALLGVSIIAALADSRMAIIRARQQLTEETEAKVREQNLRLEAAKMQLDVAVNNMPHGLCMFDADQHLLVCNDRYAEMYGLLPEHMTPGTTLRSILERRVATGNAPEDADAYIEDRIREVCEGKPYSKENELRDGRFIAVIHQPMSNGGWVAIHHDVTEQRKIEMKIAHMAHHDALTGLPNRLLFREEVEKRLVFVRRGESFAVLCLDLDHFKNINDTFGHPVGDALLQVVAARLSDCVRETDIVARLGGDEFAIVQVATEQPLSATALSQRLLDVMSSPFEVDGHQVVIGTSIGVAIAPADGVQPDQLLKNADMALYRAKADGRNAFHFFEAAMDAKMQARRSLELDLRKALGAGEFELFYQPQINLDNNEVNGFEALLRWNHPTRGRVTPDQFIALAEETGLIVPLGEWVLRQACSQATSWPANIKVAINLSPVQFRNKSLVPSVLAAIAAARLSPDRLELEITEAVLLQNSSDTISMLHQLRRLGVRIAMDDFGTGYSSLSYLRSFPFDKIKIDRSFIRDLTLHDDSIAIIRAVSRLGRDLGMSTTAEGVETEEQLAQVKAEGCTEAQGYFFSAPCSASELPKVLGALESFKAVA
jgi:diguanylate cyclase (GGDEF)-like protein